MNCETVLLVTILIAFANIANPALAPFIIKCKSDDAECAKASTIAALPVFAKGIPELGVKAMDPLPYATLDTSSKDLKFILSDIKIAGFRNCIPTKIKRDVAKSKLYMEGTCNLILDGQYEMNGRLLFIPIEGKGKAHVELNKIAISADIDMGEKIGKDGIKHWDVKSLKHTYELQDKAVVELENLFQGNDLLGRAARELLRSNPNEIVNEVGPPIIKAVILRIAKTVNHFFHQVPADELSLDQL